MRSAKCLGVYEFGEGNLSLRGTADPSLSGWPHSLQNLAPTGRSVPHDEHLKPNEAPHWRQNFEPEGFSWWHRAHCMPEPPSGRAAGGQIGGSRLALGAGRVKDGNAQRRSARGSSPARTAASRRSPATRWGRRTWSGPSSGLSPPARPSRAGGSGSGAAWLPAPARPRRRAVRGPRRGRARQPGLGRGRRAASARSRGWPPHRASPSAPASGEAAGASAVDGARQRVGLGMFLDASSPIFFPIAVPTSVELR
jgi:hypothetical protein